MDASGRGAVPMKAWRSAFSPHEGVPALADTRKPGDHSLPAQRRPRRTPQRLWPLRGLPFRMPAASPLAGRDRPVDSVAGMGSPRA